MKQKHKKPPPAGRHGKQIMNHFVDVNKMVGEPDITSFRGYLYFIEGHRKTAPLFKRGTLGRFHITFVLCKY